MLTEDISKAVQILKNGGLVAFPTETVYGLGGDAKNSDALRKIFNAKQRPVDHPLIVHIVDISQLPQWAVNVSPAAFRLAEAFWPGPLTLILHKAAGVTDLITGGQSTIGLRIPNHPIALALLKSVGSGLAAPSANRFGRISPTTAEAVCEELGSAVDWVLDGGQCEVGVESTIVDVTGEHPVILRPGMITAEQIELIVHDSVALYKRNAPRVSGSFESHYAPRTPTYLITTEQMDDYLNKLTVTGLPCVVLSRNKILLPRENMECVVMSLNPKEYAHDLYQTLRELDKKGYSQIIIEAVPNDSEWRAIRDRLERASKYNERSFG